MSKSIEEHNRQVIKDRERAYRLLDYSPGGWWCPKCDWCNLGWYICENCRSFHPSDILR